MLKKYLVLVHYENIFLNIGERQDKSFLFVLARTLFDPKQANTEPKAVELLAAHCQKKYVNTSQCKPLDNSRYKGHQGNKIENFQSPLENLSSKEQEVITNLTARKPPLFCSKLTIKNYQN